MVEYLLSGLESAFSVLSHRFDIKQAKSSAISRIRHAVRQTRKHISDHRHGEFANPNFSDLESKELATAWSHAAEAIRPFSPEWASVLEQKSDYWIDPHGFRQDIADHKKRLIIDLG